MRFGRIGVIGGGAWGTALAQVAASGGRVTIWAREAEVVAAINAHHANPLFLPGIPLAFAISATGDLEAMTACDALFVVTPAQHVRATLAQLAPSGVPLVLCAKGIEAETGMLLSEVAAELHPNSPIAVLSGPTFAHEVAEGLPTAVTLACADPRVAAAVAARLARSAFRPYLSDDVIGAEIGGAVKNVLAIACGVVAGAGLGENARAALIARGFAEMTRFGLARGAKSETLVGLSGLGDLVLTCSSDTSRNFTLGVGLGQGEDAEVLLASRLTVAEGAFTAPVLREAARAARVDMPIVDAVCDLLTGEVEVGVVIERLLARPLTRETR